MSEEPNKVAKPPLAGVALSGFKSFIRRQSVEFRNLTILAGANSSGKSTLMQALLLLKQTLEVSYDPGVLLLVCHHAVWTPAIRHNSLRVKSNRSKPRERRFGSLFPLFASVHSFDPQRILSPCISRFLTAAPWLAIAMPLAAAQWPQFRGAGAGGADESQSLPVTWNVESGQNIRWQTPIPGLAHASPIVWGDRVYVATAVKRSGEPELKVGLYGDVTPVQESDSYQWRLLALDTANGKIVWNVLGCEGVPRVKRHPKGTHCNSTPATDGRRIVAIFGSEGLFCFDREGRQVWKVDLGPMTAGWYTMPSAQFGFGSSPVIHEGKVIVLCDVLTNSFLAVFGLADGKELWRTARQDVPTWGSPTVVEAAGRKQIAVNGWHYTGGYDLMTGRNLWRLDGGGDIPVPTPVFAHGLIYLTSAHGRFAPLRAVRAEAAGDVTPADPGQTNAAIAWAYARKGNYMQTPIVVGDRLFACNDYGVLNCFDARTGALRYTERLSASGHGFTASPVSDGRHLYFTSEMGVVFVVAVGDKFSLAATNELRETCLSTPAIAGGSLFFRTRGKLIAVAGLAGKSGSADGTASAAERREAGAPRAAEGAATK